MAPPRSGQQNQRRAENDAKDRCRRWLEGQRGTLWRPPGRKRSRQQGAPPSMHERMARAEALLQEGMLFKKACASLVDGSVVDMTPE
eukprot:5542149-Amphidinium_carterae.1